MLSMPLAVLMALSIMAAEPAIQLAQADAPATADAAANTETEDIPPGAPTDNYGFVGWCYGALDEYLAIYPKVLPDLKDIDKMFGTPVKEEQPYAADVALEKKALKRFLAAMQAAEKANPQAIGPEGEAAIAQGRAIWSMAETQPSRKLADAWLFWGIPVRCETTAKALKDNPAAYGQAVASQAAPPSDAPQGAPSQ
jgi:hypothetical protein